MQKIFKHVCCRNKVYPRSDVNRFKVPDEFVNWSTNYQDYNPAFFESNILKGKPWADPPIDDANFSPTFNDFDQKYNVNRKSYTGIYEISNKYPLNPFGRTGVKGRGILGRWGPNHAADPVGTFP
jgi:ADP-ribose pyrophosphatase